MATLEEIAPDIAGHMTVEQAKALAIPEDPPVPALSHPTKQQILAAVEMLPWVGARWIPETAPASVRDGVGLSDIARKTGLDVDFVKKLREQVAAIQVEKSKGDDGFKPDPAKLESAKSGDQGK